MLWTLHLAVKLGLKDLKAFCKEQIGRNFASLLKCIEFVECNDLLTTQNQWLSAQNLTDILPEVLLVTKDVVDNRLNSSLVYPWILSSRQPYTILHSNIITDPMIQFSLSASMRLTDIVFTDASVQSPSMNIIPLEGTISVISTITTKNSSMFRTCMRVSFRKQFEMDEKNNYLKVLPPIEIHANQVYTITIHRTKPSQSSVYANAVSTARNFVLAKGINVKLENNPTFTLIDRLHFEKV